MTSTQIELNGGLDVGIVHVPETPKRIICILFIFSDS